MNQVRPALDLGRKNLLKSGKRRDLPSADGGMVLGAREMRSLAAISKIRKLGGSTFVIHEGDRTDTIYVVKSGRVKAFLSDPRGKEVVLNLHGPGEFFGEMVLDEGPRSASVITIEPSVFLLVSKADFQYFLEQHPDFSFKLLAHLMLRIRTLTRKVGTLALLDAYGRVARFLLDRAVVCEGQLEIPERLTQSAIAEQVGCSREMVSRIFKDLVAGDYISVRKQYIVIKRDLPTAR